MILTGSPKKLRSTSGSIGEYLAEELTVRNIDSKIINLKESLKDEISVASLLTELEKTDIVFLIFPLYIGSLPYHVVEILELIRKNLKPSLFVKKSLIFISHSGLDAEKNKIANSICRKFSDDLGLNFIGGFALGESGIINGKPLVSLGKLTKNLRKALELIADSIESGKPITGEVEKLMSKSSLPVPLFVKKIIFNNVMKTCYREKDFSRGIEILHGKMIK